jgi:hypothetical protein
MKVSEFMLQLAKDLQSKKEVAESTATAYVKTLYMLNNKAPFKNLSFLKDTAEVEKKVAEYKPNTQKSILTSITSVLSLWKDKPTYKKVYTFYFEKMMGKAKEMKDGEVEGEKSETQKDNWLSWEEVSQKRDDLQKAVGDFMSQKHLTTHQYETLLKYMVLSLYTEVPPRRNQDYMDMWVVIGKKSVAVDSLPKDKNYLVIEGKTPKQFVFHKFKTAKTYGTQTLPIPSSLAEVITQFLKHHPNIQGTNSKTTEFKFLVSADGTPITAVNAITRILNKVMGKKVGSSLLRHIYLSSKYGDEFREMKEDAEAMGHSVQEAQHTYIKTDEPV